MAQGWEEQFDQIDFAAWVADNAKTQFTSLSQPQKSFLNPIFQDKRLEGFWSDFANAGRGFFCELYMHLLFSNAHFEKACVEHENLKKEGYDLDERIHAFKLIEKYLSASPSFDALNEALKSDKYDLLRAIQQHKERYDKLTIKNPYRPRNRQSFNSDVRLHKHAESMAIGLYNFFQLPHIQKDWKKTSARLKAHVCNIIDALIDRKDDPLTIPALNDLINNFQKRS